MFLYMYFLNTPFLGLFFARKQREIKSELRENAQDFVLINTSYQREQVKEACESRLRAVEQSIETAIRPAIGPLALHRRTLKYGFSYSEIWG